jgi:glycosyltransferase involved in cell wall biosynthesis
LDAPLFRYTAAHVDGTILHSQTAAARFAADVRRPICAWIAPHPHYRDAYPRDGRPRSEQRADYGLDESSFVYLMFGQARAYKRIPQAIRAFRELSDEDARLIVAGAPVDDGIAEDIVQAAGGDKRVLLLLRFIPDSEVSTLFELSDAAVLNHREVFSSGILLLALSYGVPVVAPQEGSARDVAGPPAVETFPAGGLSGALSAVRQVQAETRRRVALEAVEPFTYDALADEVLKAYIGEGGTKVTSDHAAASV